MKEVYGWPKSEAFELTPIKDRRAFVESTSRSQQPVSKSVISVPKMVSRQAILNSSAPSYDRKSPTPTSSERGGNDDDDNETAADAAAGGDQGIILLLMSAQVCSKTLLSRVIKELSSRNLVPTVPAKFWNLN